MFETQPPLTSMHMNLKRMKGKTAKEGFKNLRSKSLNLMQNKMQFKKKIRHAPISLMQL